MKTYVAVVTPEMARAWLENNAPNRPVKNTTVDLYAAEMSAGRWDLNGSTLVFGEDTRLIDGQHRLRACVRSGVSFPSLVVEGVNPETALTIDGGVKRNHSDHLAFRGEQNTAALSGLARAAFCYELRKNRYQGVRISTRDMIEYINANPTIRDTAQKVFTLKKKAPLSLMGAGVVHFIATARYAAAMRADDFLESVATGANLDEGDPRLAYRNRLMKGDVHNQQQKLWAAYLAWNMWIEGKQTDRFWVPVSQVSIIPPVAQKPRLMAAE